MSCWHPRDERHAFIELELSVRLIRSGQPAAMRAAGFCPLDLPIRWLCSPLPAGGAPAQTNEPSTQRFCGRVVKGHSTTRGVAACLQCGLGRAALALARGAAPTARSSWKSASGHPGRWPGSGIRSRCGYRPPAGGTHTFMNQQVAAFARDDADTPRGAREPGAQSALEKALAVEHADRSPCCAAS